MDDFTKEMWIKIIKADLEDRKKGYLSSFYDTSEEGEDDRDD